jgi:very-short-patch-repair endonuclease
MKYRVNERQMFFGAEPKTHETAKLLRKNMTLAEKVLWKKLKDRKLFKTKFRRQHPIDFFIADFYNHEHKLVIEVDGEIHRRNESKDYDSGRTYELEKHGIRVLRFTNHQVITDINSVTEEILRVLDDLPPFRGAGGSMLV